MSYLRRVDMVRKSQRNRSKARINRTLEEFTPKGLSKGAIVKIESWTDADTGEVAHYALAYINPLLDEVQQLLDGKDI